MRVEKNLEKKGIELYFTVKPSKEIRDKLKGVGFRWHSVKLCWYAKDSKERLELIKSLIEN